MNAETLKALRASIAHHEMTKEAIIEQINQLFGDTSRSQTATLNDLEEIQADIECKIDALKEDIKRTEREAK